MKKIFVLITGLFSFFVTFGQWDPEGNNTTTGSVTIGDFTFNNGLYAESDDDIRKVIDHSKYDNYILGWAWSEFYGDNTRIGWGGSNVGEELIISETKGLHWSGNVNLGEINNNAKLNITTSALSSAEKHVEFKVSDSDDYLRIQNTTLTDGQFIPSLQSYRASDNRGVLYFIAKTASEQDNGTNPLMVFDSRQSTGVINNRPLFSWESYGNSKMVLNSNGSVGIGTTDIPENVKLGVNGKIAATEVKVALYDDWSDFVFEKDYDLPTLKEVENHINEKGHLQDIPSAAEVAENGFFLGEMDAKLLQKIEELTLYTIEQEKKIMEFEDYKKEQNQKMELLFEKLRELENKL